MKYIDSCGYAPPGLQWARRTGRRGLRASRPLLRALVAIVKQQLHGGEVAMVSHPKRVVHRVPARQLAHQQPRMLARWLCDRGHEVSGSLAITRLGSGRSTQTSFATDEADRGWVVRETRPGFAHDVRREAEVMAALAGSGLPVPGLIGHGTGRGGVSFIVMEHVSGESLKSEADAGRLHDRDKRQVSRQLVGILARLHQLDPSRLGVPARATPFLSRQLGLLLDSWNRYGSDSRHDSAWRAVLRRLIDLEPSVPSVRPSLLHGDFRLSNVLLRRGHVVALLDWELSTAGDPIADLAWLVDDWRSAGEPAIWLPTPTRVGGFPPRSDLINDYREISGRSLRALGYYRGFNYWRAATLMQGIAQRRRLGLEESASDDHELDETVSAMLISASDQLQHSTLQPLAALSLGRGVAKRHLV